MMRVFLIGDQMLSRGAGLVGDWGDAADAGWLCETLNRECRNSDRHPSVAPDGSVAIAMTARASGARIVFNAASARGVGNNLMNNVEVLIVNRVEAEAMCGMPAGNRASARDAMAKLASPSRVVIITLGGDRLVVATKDGEVLDTEPVPVHVPSTCGAGDCIVGVLSAQLAAGHSLIAACRDDARSATACVSRSELTLRDLSA